MPSTICGKWIPSGKLKDKMSWKGYRSGWWCTLENKILKPLIKILEIL
jgi:hypothetical protein